MNVKLKFAKGNAKLGKKTAIFSLPAGFTCPGAMNCLSKVDPASGKIKDGPKTEFRCYAASSEALFSNVRKGRWNNFNKLKGKSVCEMTEIILASLPTKSNLCRIHASGDFFSQDYFDAWIKVAQKRPDVIFYCYTKALPFWIRRLACIPVNFKIVASKGGRYDKMIEEHNLRSVEVIYSESAANVKQLKIDHDDSLVWNYDKDFAILLHGTQPAGSAASKAWQKIKATVGGYKSEYFAHSSSANKNAYKKAQLVS